jgi:peptidoglycan hydrolase CwlO-like protein
MKIINKLKIPILIFSILISLSPAKPNAIAATSDEQAQLQQQLQEIESQIAQYQKDLNGIKGEKNTLQNKINQLQKQQASLNLQIQAAGIQINELGGKISNTQDAISENKSKSEELKQQIGQSIQLLREQDDAPLPPVLLILLTQNSLSEAVSAFESYAQISNGLKEMLNSAKDLDKQLNQQQQNLSDQQDNTKNLLSIQSLQRQSLYESTSQQTSLLQQTKGEESNYQIILSGAQKKAQELRNRLYQLADVPNQINFGQAVEIAQWASGQTGVRAAFLLAILTQESNLGKNIGTCNRPGDPPSKSWKVVMNPTRDQPIFSQITEALGIDPDTTPISCPMYSGGKQIGWGGAMGPAQFIPSTWAGYQNRVSAITGKPADPWDIRDAFLASAIKLAADGATTQSGEWAAAMRYFCGSTNTKYRFYGNNVVAQADKYQDDIDAMNQ